MIGEWTFFSNHGHVLVCLARNGRARLRDVAMDVGITERAVQKIVKDLQEAGYVHVRKQGRCNRYRINRRKFLRHDLESHCTVGKLLALVATGKRTAADVMEAQQAEAAEWPEAVQAATDPEPGPEPEPRAETSLQSQDIAEPKSEPKSETEAEAEAEAAPKRSDEDDPVDIRQQGSLF